MIPWWWWKQVSGYKFVMEHTRAMLVLLQVWKPGEFKFWLFLASRYQHCSRWLPRWKKQTAIKPEPRLFNPDTLSSVFQCQAKSCGSGIYTSHRPVFDHGLLQLKLDFHLISPNLAWIPSQILGLFKSSLHPALTGSKFPCPEEWIFEEGEWVIVFSKSGKKAATIAAINCTHL